jgi:hypothetical protein
MGKANNQTGAENEGQNPPASEKEKAKAKRVRVICEGTLGPKLLRKGDVTDDPEYVALLEDERGRTLVQEVK